MKKLTFPMPAAARWWLTAFFIGVVFSALARRFFPEAVPWSGDFPERTQAALRLFAGLVVGMALQAIWWAGRRAIRQA